jgi:cytochrome c5
MRSRLLFVTLLSMLALAAVIPAAARSEARTGKQVVDEVCAACHASGANGAPRIGDADAWNPRAARGLSNLTEKAVKGVRNMRVHGGSPGQWRPSAARAQWRIGDMPARGGNHALTDLEIERAVIYMVNKSGGNGVEQAQ